MDGTITATRVLRLFIGLVVGFLGAFVTVEAIERFGTEPGSGERLETVLGEPDFDQYCRHTDESLRGVATTSDAFGWQCVGFVRSLWTAEGIDVGALCRWQFGADARERLTTESSVSGWRCVTDP